MSCWHKIFVDIWLFFRLAVTYKCKFDIHTEEWYKRTYHSSCYVRRYKPLCVVGGRRYSMDAKVANSEQTAYGKYREPK